MRLHFRISLISDFIYVLRRSLRLVDWCFALTAPRVFDPRQRTVTLDMHGLCLRTGLQLVTQLFRDYTRGSSQRLHRCDDQ